MFSKCFRTSILFVSKRCSNQFSFRDKNSRRWQLMTITNMANCLGGGGRASQKIPQCKILRCFMDFMFCLNFNDETCCFEIFQFAKNWIFWWLLGNLCRNKAFVESENVMTFHDFPPLMVIAEIGDNFEEPIWQQQIPFSSLLFRIFGRSLSAETTQTADLWTTLMMTGFCRHLQHNKHNKNAKMKMEHSVCTFWCKLWPCIEYLFGKATKSQHRDWKRHADGITEAWAVGVQNDIMVAWNCEDWNDGIVSKFCWLLFLFFVIVIVIVPVIVIVLLLLFSSFFLLRPLSFSFPLFMFSFSSPPPWWWWWWQRWWLWPVLGYNTVVCLQGERTLLSYH